MKKLIVLVGTSGTGKDAILNKIELLGDIHRCVSHTTRPIRENEIDHIAYHFTEKEDFLHMSRRKEFIETRSYDTLVGGNPDTWYYGLHKSEVNLEKHNCIVIVDMEGLKELEEYFGENNVLSILIHTDEEIRRERFISRGDDPTEVERRIEDDNEKFYYADQNVDEVVDNHGTITEAVYGVTQILIENGIEV